MDKKTKSYQSRFQVKRRRRREGKTDYKSRINLIRPNNRNFGMDKMRLVVRTTNKKVIAQLVSSFKEGDRVLMEANSNELIKLGLPVGLTNFTAHYLTGLLLAKKFTSANISDQLYAVLDIGLKKSTRGGNVYSAMKGAIDGGLEIPYSNKIFFGYEKGEEFTGEQLKEEIFGGKIIAYMTYLKENDEEQYKKHFASYLANKIDESNYQLIIEQVISKINEFKYSGRSEKKNYSEFKKYKVAKLSLEEKKIRQQEKLQLN